MGDFEVKVMDLKNYFKVFIGKVQFRRAVLSFKSSYLFPQKICCGTIPSGLANRAFAFRLEGCEFSLQLGHI